MSFIKIFSKEVLSQPGRFRGKRTKEFIWAIGKKEMKLDERKAESHP